MQAREVLDSSCDVDGAANEGVLNQVLARHQTRDADAAVEADAHCKRWVTVLLELSLVILELHSHRQGGVDASSVCRVRLEGAEHCEPGRHRSGWRRVPRGSVMARLIRSK